MDFRILLFACVPRLESFSPTKDANMNGNYLLSRTPNAPTSKSFPTNFSDFPGGVEYFEVYHGPIKSVYSEVFWTQISNDIPQEIVKRFDGKVMAIVGIEMDQVRKTPEGDIPVPITLAYNHHHDTAVVGKGSALEEVDMHDPRVKAAGRRWVCLDKHKVWLPIEHTPSNAGVATSAMFSDGNGGEYRKTFHAYAPPFAQLVDSPMKFAGAPMQIDTWNRDKMNLTGSPFVTGPLPRHSLAPTSGPDALYSGLLECPLTTRIQKIFGPGSEGFNDSYIVQVSQCAHNLTTPDSCFAAAAQVPALINASINKKILDDDSVPSGCSVVVRNDGKSATALFNTKAKSRTSCEAGANSDKIGSAQSLVTVHANISVSTSIVTLTLTGPEGLWFGIGFGASVMSGTYAVVVSGNGSIHERILGDHEPGSVLGSSVEVVSNIVVAGERTLVLTRPVKGATKDHYTFPTTTLSIPFINAIGTGPVFAVHRVATGATLSLWPTGVACICKLPALPFGQGTGFIKYIETGESVGFGKRCDNEPREDLIRNRNPTCDLRTYAGGLATCHHGWKLLDADQEIPWQDQPLEYYKKFRIYFQEYNASFHKQIIRQDWGIGADGDHAEYDVPQCAPGTPVEKCTHTIQGTWIPVPASSPDMYLVAAHHHCHAPTCLKIELWNNDTGKLLCRQEPVYGGSQGDWQDSPAYSEPGYIATPPCLWGSPEHGLEAPPLMSGVTIQVVAVTNSTYGHHGEMALPEISLVQGPLSIIAPEILI